MVNKSWTDPLYFLICDYLPITSNLNALIFGVIRYKDKIVSYHEDEVIPTRNSLGESENPSKDTQSREYRSEFFDPPNFELYEGSFQEEQQHIKNSMTKI